MRWIWIYNKENTTYDYKCHSITISVNIGIYKNVHIDTFPISTVIYIYNLILKPVLLITMYMWSFITLKYEVFCIKSWRNTRTCPILFRLPTCTCNTKYVYRYYKLNYKCFSLKAVLIFRIYCNNMLYQASSIIADNLSPFCHEHDIGNFANGNDFWYEFLNWSRITHVKWYYIDNNI